jgi:tRNA splicing endonuclease
VTTTGNKTTAVVTTLATQPERENYKISTRPEGAQRKILLRFFYTKNRGNALQLNGCDAVFLTDKCTLLTTNLQPLVTTLFQIP